MKFDFSVVINVVIAMIIFRVLDNMLLSKVPFLSYEEDNLDDE